MSMYIHVFTRYALDVFIHSSACLFLFQVNKYFREYAFSEVVTAIFNFFLYDLCDYYLELTKQRLAVCTPGEKSASSSRLSSLCALEVLYVCLDRGLRLLHPLCPFITEELYQRLPANETKADSICIADYPQPVLQWMDFRLDVRKRSSVEFQ